MRSFVLAVVVALGTLAAPAAHPNEPAAAPASAQTEKCEHGVKKVLCTRCNPKLVPVFKAKGDWCAEHQVPESQCARCNPRLAKEGVK